jgi:sulfide:quinone oxidoreductase
MTAEDARHVLIAGGGVAAFEAALALRKLAGDRTTVELLTPEPQFWYRPTAVAEPFGHGKVRHFDVGTLAQAAGATTTLGELRSVDAPRGVAYTSARGAVPFDALLIACGANPVPAVEGALTFRGPADTALVEETLAEVEAGHIRRLAFVVPAGATWSLPMYELALMTAAWLAERNVDGAELALVTPESEPLQLFGREASDTVRTLLEESGIVVHVLSHAAEARPGELLLVGGGVLACDRALALPRLQGPRIAGIPQTFEGFVPVDPHGRVTGLEGVYAAGDITTFPFKQGGIAAQQAEAAAEAIVADLGLGVAPRPFRPVLRGLLLTGAEPRFLHTELPDGGNGRSWASAEPLWWPPAKIVGRYLSPFLAGMVGSTEPAEPPSAGVPVEVELDRLSLEDRRHWLMDEALDVAGAETSDLRVGDIMSAEPLLVAPEDTLGELAEAMRDRGAGAALVAHYGKLIGIVTSRDLLEAFADRVHPSDARARAWMTAEPITVSAETPAEVAVRLMTRHGVHHLPVVDGERPVGVVGLRDLVRSAAAQPSHSNVGLGF